MSTRSFSACVFYFFPGNSWKIARRCITWPCSCTQVKKPGSQSVVHPSLQVVQRPSPLCRLPQGPINRASETFIKAFACYSIDVDAGTTPQHGAERHQQLKAVAIHRVLSYSAVTSSMFVRTRKHTSCVFAKLPAAVKRISPPTTLSLFL